MAVHARPLRGQAIGQDTIRTRATLEQLIVNDTRILDAQQKADEMRKLHGPDAEAKLIEGIAHAVRTGDHAEVTRLDAALRVIENGKPKRRRF